MRMGVRMGVPDVEVLVKHKYREDLADAPVKVREILRHGGHPFRLANRKLSRCLSLVWKFAESLPSSVEVVSMENLKSFVHKLRGEGVTPGLWGELDVVEMFANIPRPLVVMALEHYWQLLCEARGCSSDRLIFHVHKGGLRSLDYIGAPSRDSSFHHLSFHDVLSFVVWDLTWNDCFVHYSSVFCQCKGVPIGGSASAQYASIVLMYLERNVSWGSFPPCMRYRDNYLFYLRASDRNPGEYLAGVSERLQDAVGLPLQVEGWGESLDCLESTLCFTNGLPDIGLKVPLAFAPRGSPTPPQFVKMVDAHSPNAPRVLQSFIPNIFRKANWYRFDDLRFVINIGHMIRLLRTKGYPSAWWRPTMFAKAAALDMSCLMHVAWALGADE